MKWLRHEMFLRNMKCAEAHMNEGKFHFMCVAHFMMPASSDAASFHVSLAKHFILFILPYKSKFETQKERQPPFLLCYTKKVL